MKRQIRINAAAVIFNAVRKLDTGQELVLELLQPSFGRFGGSTIVSHVVSTDGVELSSACVFLEK